jgi:spermidine/putrescine transport system ATP-binding protein
MSALPLVSETVAQTDARANVFDVEVHDLVHFYGRTPVINGINIQIRKGEFFSLLGPSGSGKTTTLRIIGGFVAATSGGVLIEGVEMRNRPPYQRNTTMVFQQLALFPHMTVFENVTYGLRVRRRPKPEIQERAAAILRLVRLEGLEKRFPSQISGGQQQRVALARSLVLRPSVVLFDEPLGALDLKLRREMQVELKNLQRMVGTTFVYVTHDQEEALTMSDRIAVMNSGRIEQIGTPEEVYEHPATRFVAEFIGDTNLIDGRVTAIDAGVATVSTAEFAVRGRTRPGVELGDAASISVRPENAILLDTPDDDPWALSGVIEDMIYTGSRRRTVLRVSPALAFKVDAPASEPATRSLGDTAWVTWPADRAHALK